MPGTPHERLVLLLKAQPRLIRVLLRLAARSRTNAPSAAADPLLDEIRYELPALHDSTVRGASPEEYHPDLVFADGPEGYALVTEVQQSRNDAKKTSWPSLSTTLNHQRKAACDLLVITHDAEVARWARKPTLAHGPLGTTFSFAPAVLHIDDELVSELLAMDDPAAALIAVWTQHDSTDVDGRAVAIANQAVQTILNKVSPELRVQEIRAMLELLIEPIARKVIEAMKSDHDHDHDYEPHTVADEFFAEIAAKGKLEGTREGKLEGTRDGKREGKLDGLRIALVAVLNDRGFSLSEHTERAIAECTDPAQLQAWLLASVSCKSVREVFGD